MILVPLLLLLRLLGAFLLLGFFIALAWFIYQDLQTHAGLLTQQNHSQATLQIIASHTADLPIGSRYPLRPVTSIGRAATSTIVLNNGYTSSEHALITRRGEQWWLEDLGSRNGTLLNEARLKETAVISNGDIITIGDIQLKLEL